jgi:LysR family transcriptional regulator, hca operon transcriptional activator
VVFPRDHRFAERKAIRLREIKGEPFIKPSKTAPTLRKIIEDSLKRSGVDTRAIHEVHNLAHAFSMIASTRAVTLLPAYAKNFLPSSIVSRPIHGEAPTVDLALGYNKANTSHILKLFLARVEDMIAGGSSRGQSPMSAHPD